MLIDDPEALAAQRQALTSLPCDAETGAYDASSGAIRALKQRTKSDPALAQVLATASTPAPLYPPLVRPLVEAWAMTSLETNAGRPIVSPWLRGWVDSEVQTTIVWRTYLPRRQDGSAGTKKETTAFLEAAPVHLSETLQGETWRVLQWVTARAEAAQQRAKRATHGVEASEVTEEKIEAIGLNEVVAFVDPGDGKWQPRTLAELVPHHGDNRAKTALERLISEATVVLDARLGGLSGNGLLDDAADEVVTTADGDGAWLGTASGAEVVGFRVRELRLSSDTATAEPTWQERARFVVQRTPTGEPLRVLCVDKWNDAAMEEDRSLMKHNQSLAQHQSWAEQRALSLAQRLGLPREGELARALALAAKLHDEGKRAARWQEAFNAPKDGVYAKTRGPINQARLDGYRHELGSFLDAREHAEVAALSPELRDLVLHLIVSHHGFARPVIGLAGVDRRPPTMLKADAAEIAERFSRLTESWGPWGLAWWEAVLRAADQQASRDNDSAAGTATSGRA